MPNQPDSHVAGHKAERRTAQKIAQDKLAAANDKLKKLDARVVRLETDLADAKAQREALVADRDYRAAHPALQAEGSTSVQPPTATGGNPPVVYGDLDALEGEE